MKYLKPTALDDLVSTLEAGNFDWFIRRNPHSLANHRVIARITTPNGKTATASAYDIQTALATALKESDE